MPVAAHDGIEQTDNLLGLPLELTLNRGQELLPVHMPDGGGDGL
ncbi:MAG: hypothetical protein SGJ11_13725 [Phycisphaerae bacterium]|nr:hypothetical protein [Phycisphaerae bacterium]